MMQYMVESFGASFTKKDIQQLADIFGKRAAEGYRLHSVFPVERKGCLGGTGTMTYLAIYEKPDK